jgi:hypothetical protein
MPTRKTTWDTPPATAEEARARYEFIESVLRSLPSGRFTIVEVESAIGMYLLALPLGWKVLYLLHSKKTIRKYEEILGLKLSEHFPEFGPDADRTNAYKLIKAVSNFWKLVSGDEKPPLDLDKRVIIDKGT